MEVSAPVSVSLQAENKIYVHGKIVLCDRALERPTTSDFVSFILPFLLAIGTSLSLISLLEYYQRFQIKKRYVSKEEAKPTVYGRSEAFCQYKKLY